MTMRTPHSAAREACSGSSQRREERSGQVAGDLHHPVESAEGDVGQDGTGLVLEEVGQGLVPAKPAGRRDHAGDQHVLEVTRLAHGHGQG